MIWNPVFAALLPVGILIPLAWTSPQAGEEVTRDKILAAGPAWQEIYDKYEPPSDMVDALKSKMSPGMKIDVYLGLWCPDSRNNVPPFIKILDRLGAEVTVRYVNVPRKASREIKYYVDEFQVTRVPTFILYRDGAEIGRIVENPKMGMMEDIMEIVWK
jgi:hypothetical protein